ncbi:MAG: hypothetical protein H0W73_06795 [Bacteroidetes bacterium]|nr:hypothetical protein [Bacteroidota bacterium]
MNKILYVAGFSLLVALSSCGDKQSDELKETVDSLAVDNTPKDTTPITVNEDTKFKFDFAIANIPSPVASVNELSSWGVPYNSSFLIDTKKQLTGDEFNKALQLGAFNIDMSYAMVNNVGEDVLKYMKAVLVKSDALGLKSAVDQMVGKRAEQNIANKDSLLRILDEIFIKSDSYLRTNERVYTAAAVFAGSWIEALYLTCKITEAATEPAVKEKGYKELWDQRFYLKNLSELLDEYKDKKECAALNAQFKVVLNEITVIKDPKDFKEANFKSISEKIYALRAAILK